jgi:hypothetical protein
MTKLNWALFVTGCLSVNAIAVAGKGPDLEFDQFVSPDFNEMLFGDGNLNGGFTTNRDNGVEVGLRAKQRFPSPANIFYSNGDGTYSVPKGEACPGFGFAPNCAATPFWSFEWSVNVDYDYAGAVLSDYTYELGMDADPSDDTDFTMFDPITPTPPAVPFFDHGTGGNGTTNGTANTAATEAEYVYNLDVDSVAQNSWNYEFFNNIGTSLANFDPSVDGNYVIFFRVLDDKRKVVAETYVQILAGDALPLRKVKLPKPEK